MNRNDIKAEGEQQTEISPTAKYKPITPFVPVENWMRFPHRRLSTALRQSNFHCNLRARFPQDGPGVYFIYMQVKHPIDF